jgi:hypothetical protein
VVRHDAVLDRIQKRAGHISRKLGRDFRKYLAGIEHRRASYQMTRVQTPPVHQSGDREEHKFLSGVFCCELLQPAVKLRIVRQDALNVPD